MATLKEAEDYYKRKGELEKVVTLKLINSDEVVYGARAVNKQLPSYLRRHTEDWDIATPDDPQQVAREIEQSLDKRYGGNFFKIEPAQHKGTYKVISNITGSGVVDVTVMENKIDHRRIGKINYATLDYQLSRIKASLSDSKAKFRHKKDVDTRQRIKIHQKRSSAPKMKAVK